MQSISIRFVSASLLLCGFLIGCGASTQKRRIPSVPVSTSTQPASTASPATSMPTRVSVPSTVAPDFKGLPVEVVFRRQVRLGPRKIEALYHMTREHVDNLILVSNIDLDVLKAFVAQGWAPVVRLQYRNNKPHMWAVIGYDDPVRQIQLGNPVTRARRNRSYVDFEREWAVGSARKCLLVTPRKLGKTGVYAILKKYLPSVQAAQVKIRSGPPRC